MSRNRARAKVITETFDPALWSIATVLSVAVIYVAYLT